MCDRDPLFMRNLKPLLFSLAIFGLAMNLPLSAVTGEGELKAENCSTADFFREADVKGTLSSDVSGFQRVKAFPVLVNAIYKPPRDGAVRHYSVVCRFNLAQVVKEDRFLYLPGIGENFAIYLNGEKIHDDMHVQNGRLIRYRYTKFMNLPLPSHLVRPGNNTLFFHIAGYAPLTPLSDNFLLGLPFRSGYAISTEREQGPGSLLLFFLTASYIFFGLYHFFFYLRWREKQYNLHFAVFSLAISAYFLAFSQEAFFRVSDTRYLIMVSYSCQMLALGFFLLYVQKFFFETYRVPLYIRIGVVADLVLAALVLAGRDTWQQSLLTFWYFTALPQILVVFYLIGRAVKQRLPDARTLALAIFMALLMIAFDMLDTLVFYSSVRLSQFAYFTVVVSLVLLMANRFISIHNETDRLNRQLSVERNSFSRFVPSQFLENLGKSTALEIRRGDTAQRQMGILFLDIRNFTGIAEKLTPAESLVFLNVFMRKMERSLPVLTYTAIANVGGGYVFFLLMPITWAALAFRPEAIPPWFLQIMNDWVWFIFILSWPPFAIFMILIAVAIFCDHNRPTIFPRWVAFFNIWCAILIIPAALIEFFKTGPFAYDGEISFWFIYIVFFGWIMVMSVITLRAAKAEQIKLAA